ncbi:hypothetical protein [Kosmotoga olearia]|uniref:Uncharacterized protein n=1 Tax=Kosmotoga olearia (strain ATCC BAA-1733 / DSM 21960 / TBF 19.5.1) TaxID=521045 RepID=C5CH40_KOSOT|nr:hypothetical protein [Kosmotoga olearia]ACR80643.1 hypothetical protein Kole_1962 [Kosmotoga olearia TBF 19.5.1]
MRGLKIYYYPEPLLDRRRKPVKFFLNDLKKKRPALHKKVDLQIKKLMRANIFIFNEMIKNKNIYPLGDGLYELRVPKRAKGGVVRLYFMFSPWEEEALILLDAELKKQDSASTKTALTRQKDVLKSLRRQQK